MNTKVILTTTDEYDEEHKGYLRYHLNRVYHGKATSFAVDCNDKANRSLILGYNKSR